MFLKNSDNLIKQSWPATAGCAAQVAGEAPSRFSDFHSEAARNRRANAAKIADNVARSALVAAQERGAEGPEASADYKAAWLAAYKEHSGL